MEREPFPTLHPELLPAGTRVGPWRVEPLMLPQALYSARVARPCAR